MFSLEALNKMGMGCDGLIYWITLVNTTSNFTEEISGTKTKVVKVFNVCMPDILLSLKLDNESSQLCLFLLFDQG